MTQDDSTQELLAEFLPDAQAIELRKPHYTRRLTLYVLFVLVCVVIVWAIFSELDKVVIGHGRLVTPLPNLVVQPMEPGILKAIKVRVGEVVKKDQVLALLDPTVTNADASQLASRHVTLSLQVRRLEAELAGKKTLKGEASEQRTLQLQLLAERQAAYTSRILQFNKTIEHLRATLTTNYQDRKILGELLKTLNAQETMRRRLAEEKLGSVADLLQIRERRLEAERSYTQAVNRKREIESEIAATEAERTTYTKTWRQEIMDKLSAAMQQRDEVNDQLAKARLRSDMVTLTAPEAAIVLEIGKKSVGSVVQEAEPLFTLVPVNAELQAEVEVSTSDVGDLRVGDKARIKIDAYPFQKHGTMPGKVLNISADAFSRKTMGNDAYYYLARIRLEDTKLKYLPNPTLLMPGLTLTGEIITGKRTVISYFLYPILRILDESLREK